MNYEQRVKDCKRRASIAYPYFMRARKAFDRYARLWTYWENRAWEAQRKATAVTVIPPNQNKKSIERQKERIAQSFKALSVEDRKKLLEELKGGSL